MLRLLASAWSSVAAARAALYRRGSLPCRRLSRPVVSVGALAVGGTGKTPGAALVAGLLVARGRRPAILSRGYRRRGRTPLLVSAGDGGGPRVSVERAGDEPWWLARVLPTVPVAVAARREAAAERVLEASDPDTFVLDDGFQHLRVDRDADCLVVDARTPFWRDAPLPAGRLREAPAASRRADAFLIVADADGAARRHLDQTHPGRPAFGLRRAAPRVWRLADYRDISASDLAAAQPPDRLPGPLLAFAGIARPERFFDDVAEAGLELVASRAFQDHHAFTAADVERLRQGARDAGAAALLTTEKDAVRLPASPASGDRGAAPSIWVWSYRLEAESPDALWRWLAPRLDGGTGDVGAGRSELGR